MLYTKEYCLEQFKELSLSEQQWLIHFANEKKKAEEKHPEWPKDVIHQAAIVGEESGELLRACINTVYEGEQSAQACKEAIQTGAMCLRFLMNLGNSEFKKG